MQDKKIYIGLITILIVFFLIVFFGLEYPNIKANKLNLTLVIGNETVLNYKNQTWSSLSNQKKELNWNLFNIFIDGKSIGNYYLWWGEDKWHAFDSDNNSISLNGKILAYNANYNVSALAFSESKDINLSILEKLFNQYNIPYSNNLLPPSKIAIDFDQDGVEEDFYTISNAFSTTDNLDFSYSLAFMVKNETIYMIYEDIRKDNFYDACKPYYSGFIDVNQDMISEVILSCGRYSIQEPITTLYQFVNNDFKVIVSNE